MSTTRIESFFILIFSVFHDLALIKTSLNITKSTVGNSVVENAIVKVHDNLKEGESMVHPLTQSNIFPRSFF